MAVFNPQVAPGQDSMPNWTNVTKPISQPEADKSRGLALSNVGNAIEGTAGLVDTTMKSVIGKDVRDTVEATRTDWTSTLEQARNAQLSSVTQGNDILPANSTPTSNPPPPAVVQGVDKIGSIQAAYANGKVNDTYYSQRLMADVTSLRAKYPGYVDYIDQKVSSITGMNPANAYAQNLMQDINRAQVTKRTEVDKAMDNAMKSGYPDSDVWVNKLRQDGDKALPAFQDWYARETMFDAKIKRNDAVRKSVNDRTTDIVKDREQAFTDELGTALSNRMNTIIKIAGVDKPMTASALLKDAADNPGKYDDQTMRVFATKLLAQKAEFLAGAAARAAKTDEQQYTDPITGRLVRKTYSYNSDLTASKTQDIATNIAKYYDQMADALMSGGAKGAGIAFANAQHVDAMLGDRANKIMSDKDIGEDISTYAILNEKLGPNFAANIQDSALRARLDDGIRPLFKVRRQKGLAQPELEQGGTGVPYTFKDMAGEALSLEKQNKITGAMRARYLREGVDSFVNDITGDSPDEAKINAVKFFFSKEGQGVLPNFKDDQFDPVTGNYLPGRQTIWGKLTSDDMVRSVAKLSAKDPSIGKMYKNAIENEAGSYLYYKEFQNLQKYTATDLHFKYNDGNGKGVPNIELIGKDGKPFTLQEYYRGARRDTANDPTRSPAYLDAVQQTVGRINAALAGMDRVEKGFGGNSSENLLSFLIRAQGLNNASEFAKNWELPGRLMDAIAASAGRGKLKEIMEQGQK